MGRTSGARVIDAIDAAECLLLSQPGYLCRYPSRDPKQQGLLNLTARRGKNERLRQLREKTDV